MSWIVHSVSQGKRKRKYVQEARCGKDGEEEECVEKKSWLIVVYLVRSMSTRIVRESYVYLVS
jgi:hypothetical protein